jgi:hypothetical protein
MPDINPSSLCTPFLTPSFTPSLACFLFDPVEFANNPRFIVLPNLQQNNGIHDLGIRVDFCEDFVFAALYQIVGEFEDLR